MGPGKFQGCGRGVFGLKSWEPLRRPGQAAPARNEGAQGDPAMERRQVVNGNTDKVLKKRILAKYSYTANASSPLGTELTVKQAEKLFLVRSHPENEQWWEVQTDEGEKGFVPASYMMELKDEKPGLPWLQSQEEEEEETAKGNNVFGGPAKVAYKPYKSSYDHAGLPKSTGTTTSSANTKEYYCDICDKQLNGPKPYGAHMVSKAHKEMIEYLKT